MHHIERFQVPIEFQSSFTQIPLYRVLVILNRKFFIRQILLTKGKLSFHPLNHLLSQTPRIGAQDQQTLRLKRTTVLNKCPKDHLLFKLNC